LVNKAHLIFGGVSGVFSLLSDEMIDLLPALDRDIENNTLHVTKSYHIPYPLNNIFRQIIQIVPYIFI